MENVYQQILFEKIDTAQIEKLIAVLNHYGFEGFEEGENWLKAFIPASAFEENLFRQHSLLKEISFSVSTIEATNWNAVWESNFQPVVVDDFVGIRADFHPSFSVVEHEIIITPKMSFGTGHHATTSLMITHMQHLDCKGKEVLDFGTGTGVLAILAEKLGATKVLAIDYDSWSIENAAENFEKNNCTAIELRQQSDAGEGQTFDLILANINRNVLIGNMQKMADRLGKNGVLLLSGILTGDIETIENRAKQENLILQTQTTKDNWVCLQFTG